MARIPVIAANWKMNLLQKASVELARCVVDSAQSVTNREIIIFPSFLQIPEIASVVKGSMVGLGGQNLYFEEKGAYTGEISAEQLVDAGCSHVLIGHSERRHYFQEDYETVNKKVLTAIHARLKVMLCLGESLSEREQGVTEMVVADQLESGLQNVKKANLKKLYIAYEPIWAIGTGKTATIEDASHVHQIIRKTLTRLYDENAAQEMRILYGGSVKQDNISNFMIDENIDGVLIGRASLKGSSFETLLHCK